MLARVYGCGFPGIVSAIGLCENGCQVTAIDNQSTRVDELRAGKFWGGDLLLEQLIGKHLGSGLSFTSDPIQSDSCDFCVLSLPTSFEDGSLDLSVVINVCVKILTSENFVGKPTVLIRSTLPLHGLKKIEQSIFEQMGKKSGLDWHVAYVPEFMRQGTGMDD